MSLPAGLGEFGKDGNDQFGVLLAIIAGEHHEAGWEGMPLALLEAFRSGLPVVASDVPGNRDVVTHEVTGLLYPPGDAAAAASEVSRSAVPVESLKSSISR